MWLCGHTLYSLYLFQEALEDEECDGEDERCVQRLSECDQQGEIVNLVMDYYLDRLLLSEVKKKKKMENPVQWLQWNQCETACYQSWKYTPPTRFVLRCLQRANLPQPSLRCRMLGRRVTSMHPVLL